MDIILDSGMGRRNFIRASILAGLVLATLGLGSGCEEPPEVKTKAEPARAVSLEDVLSGAATQQEYIAFLKYDVPELRKAIESGELSDIVLYPDETPKLEKIYIGMMKNAGIGEAIAKRIAGEVINMYETVNRGEVAFVPLNRILINRREAHVFYGKSIPHPIVLRKKIFGEDHVQTDADFRTVLRYHELQHVSDYYNGIAVGGARITEQDYLGGTIQHEFLKELAELRAYHNELVRIAGGEAGVSQRYANAAISGYTTHYFVLKLTDTLTKGDTSLAENLSEGIRLSLSLEGIRKALEQQSPLQKSIISRQLEAFSDLTAQFGDGDLPQVTYHGATPPKVLKYEKER